MAEVYSQEWRDDHVRRGDAYIKQADAAASDEKGMPNIELFAMAQAAAAHFVAAGLTGHGPAHLSTVTAYMLPGIKGFWEIVGMETVMGGEIGDAVVTFRRADR